MRERLLPELRDGGRRKPAQAQAGRAGRPWRRFPEPALPALDRPWGILVTGVGGTGVVTIGALLGMAAHIEGKGVAVLDMTGLAQKGGSVYSHIRIAAKPGDIHAVRIAAGEANAVIGCDMIVAASDEAIAKMQAGHTRAVVNVDVAPTGAFTKDPDLDVPRAAMEDAIREACGPEAADFVAAGELATSLLGDSIAANLFMMGFAWQRGLVPVGREAIVQAIELNGAAVESNKAAFEWGRRAAADLASVRQAAAPAGEVPDGRRLSASLDEVIARRREQLVKYQNEAYASAICGARRARSRGRVAEVAGLDRARRGGRALPVQADGLQGRVRGGASLRRRRFRRARGEPVRGRLPPEASPRAAVVVEEGPGDRRAAQGSLWPVDAQGHGRAREIQGAAGHGARPVRLLGRNGARSGG